MIVDEHDWRHRLSPEESVDPIAAEADIRRGDIATGAAVEAVFSKYRLWGSATLKPLSVRSTRRSVILRQEEIIRSRKKCRERMASRRRAPQAAERPS